MASILCFTDTTAVVQSIQQGLGDDQHIVYHMPSSLLTEEVRQTVRRLDPDLVLLELSQAVDNPHLYFFLRSDHATRHIPVIVLSSSAQLDSDALIFDADGYLRRPFAAEQLRRTIGGYLAPRKALAAAAA